MSAKVPVSPAIKYLYYYNTFISFSLTVVASFTFIDRLLLRMHIDLGLFGTIKSVIFLLPAVAYQIASPFLQKYNNSIKVCMIGYILRGVFPSLLPFIAMINNDPKTLTVWCIILLPLGMVSAVFANNSLMQIYRNVIPSADYNYHVCTMNMLLSAPSMLLALPVALLLDSFENFSDTKFFLFFGLLQLFTVAFEIPAVHVLKKVKLKKEKEAENIKKDNSQKVSSSMFRPYTDQRFRMLMVITFIQRAINGLGSAYLTIYFLEVMKFNMTTLIIISMIMSGIMNLILPASGKLMDRFGYEKVFIFLCWGMLVGMLSFCLAWNTIWILPIFAILCWDGGASVFSGITAQVEIAATSKLADKSWLNGAVAAYSICSNLGIFIGFLLASAFYAIANSIGKGNISSTLHIYYIMNLPVFALLVWSALKFRNSSLKKHYIKLQ